MDKSKVIDNKFLIIILLFFLGFLTRFIWLCYANPEPVSDFLGYKCIAENILKNHIIGSAGEPSVYRLPLYPLFLSFFMLFNKSIFFLSLLSVFLSALIGVLVYLLTIEIYNNRNIALISSIFYILNPSFVFFSPVLSSENLFAVLLLSSLISILYFIKKKNSLFLYLSALLLGLSLLTRGEAVFYLPTVIFYIFMFTNLKLKRKVSVIFSFILIFSITISPWIIRNKIVFNEFGLSSTGGINFYFAHNPNTYGWVPLEKTPLKGMSIDRFEISKLGFKLGFEYIKKEDVYYIMNRIFKGTILLWFPDFNIMNYGLLWSVGIPKNTLPNREIVYILDLIAHYFYFLLFLLFVIFLIIVLFKRDLKKNYLLILLILSNWFCYAVVFWAKARYRFFSEIIFSTLAAYSIYTIYNFLVNIFKSSKYWHQRRSANI